MDGHFHSLTRGELINHCLLVESETGLVLVDTGYGIKDILDPYGRLSHFFLHTLLKGKIEIFCSHDKTEFERLAARGQRHEHHPYHSGSLLSSNSDLASP